MLRQYRLRSRVLHYAAELTGWKSTEQIRAAGCTSARGRLPNRIKSAAAGFAGRPCGRYAAAASPVRATPVDLCGGNLMRRRLIFGLVIAVGVAACSQPGARGTAGLGMGASAARHNPNDVEWTQHGGNPDEQRYSKLNQVTADNVGQLGLAWYAEIPERGGYQSTPLVIDGVLYMTAPWSSLYAFDAKSGKPL